jgi:hypothetical protein
LTSSAEGADDVADAPPWPPLPPLPPLPPSPTPPPPPPLAVDACMRLGQLEGRCRRSKAAAWLRGPKQQTETKPLQRNPRWLFFKNAKGGALTPKLAHAFAALGGTQADGTSNLDYVHNTQTTLMGKITRKLLLVCRRNECRPCILQSGRRSSRRGY